MKIKEYLEKKLIRFPESCDQRERNVIRKILRIFEDVVIVTEPSKEFRTTRTRNTVTIASIEKINYITEFSVPDNMPMTTSWSMFEGQCITIKRTTEKDTFILKISGLVGFNS